MSAKHDCLDCGQCESCIDRAIYYAAEMAAYDDGCDDEPDCEACGNTGWIWGADGIGVECGECNH